MLAAGFRPAVAQDPAPKDASGKDQAGGTPPPLGGIGKAQPLSSECRVKSAAYEGRTPLRSVRQALREKRPVTVLSVGATTPVGAGGSGLANYPVRLEHDLEALLRGIDVQIVSRGISGDIGDDATDRLKLEVAELHPDLVVWQVGTNDALARTEREDFAEPLRATLSWLSRNHVDVVLIDPQYVERLASDNHYAMIVKTIGSVAREARVPLVHRFDAMADLARQTTAPAGENDGFRLNELGYRCMAEYAARAIVTGIIQADLERQPQN